MSTNSDGNKTKRPERVAESGEGKAPADQLVIAGHPIPTLPVILGSIAVILVLLGVFVVVNPGGSNNSSNGVASVNQVAGSTQADKHYPGAIVTPVSFGKPDLTLTDTSGQPYNVTAKTPGQVTLVYIGYTNCADTCPTSMALAAQALELMPKDEQSKVQVVFLSDDPARDTSPVIRSWLNHFNARFVGLSGNVQQVHQVEQQVGMPSSTIDAPPTPGAGAYGVDHAGYMLVYSQDNRAHMEIDTTETAPNYAKSLEYLVKHGFKK